MMQRSATRKSSIGDEGKNGRSDLASVAVAAGSVTEYSPSETKVR